MNERHIVSAYDEDLRQLETLVSEMGGLVESQLAAALDALVQLDPDTARDVIKRDKIVDDYETRIDKHTTEMLVLRQPMAQDLRVILVALKLASNLERMGDYAKNISKRTITLSGTTNVTSAAKSIKSMGDKVLEMINEVLDAYARRDGELASAVILKDEDVDRMHTNLFREFLEMMTTDPQHISLGTHLIFIAKGVERVGDHATNVAEKIHYMLEGGMPEGDRPKDDRSSDILVEVTGSDTQS